MACGGCAQRRLAAEADAMKREEANLIDGYKCLNDRQIRARLENYKRKYCKDCASKFECDYAKYLECKKSK
jgi:hypothetical protein